MEGELCQLPEIVTICKKYKAHVYLDEAHSIGAVGKQEGESVILGEDGSSRGAQKLFAFVKIATFSDQNFRRWGLRSLNNTPVMPIMLYNPAKIPAFSRECLRQNRTLLFQQPLYFCQSNDMYFLAAHSREDLNKALEVISRVGDLIGIKYFPAEPQKQQLEENRVKLE
ncbi:serine palmitoyltransferase component [Datura stramonium]|uniref:Serine palmitoyltransferase component n=1 Tax=Datura stramonium TaxID=4076 RepID=A0ABS8SFH5_DATST|nr:serine palmitoyltransferase component [Datura stramonium]